ncbi:MAG: cobaltochelatase subunit CobT, partial [Gammaproteobacteria bacterium]|nr:cobaltochelatase subunit CobT [Gammaproteobacteria bacterium]
MKSKVTDIGIEAFRRVTEAATRAIAHEPDLNLEFTQETGATEGKRLGLKPPGANLPYGEVSRVRGQADSAALKLRYHDAAVHGRQAPSSDLGRGIYDALEQTRC